VLSLKDRLNLLEDDLRAEPPRIHVYEDLPFAVLRYEPEAEWEVRRQARLLAARLAAHGKEVRPVSLADLLWEAIDRTEGLDAVVELERERGFLAAQDQVTTYLSSPAWRPLAVALAECMRELDPRRHIVFLLRAAALGPAIYPLSKLLAEMQGKTRVPTILFYPGALEAANNLRLAGTPGEATAAPAGPASLLFLGLRDREATGSYRVKIYG
jgi:hypothetical protein